MRAPQLDIRKRPCNPLEFMRIIVYEQRHSHTHLNYSGVVQSVARQPLELVILVRVQAPEPLKLNPHRPPAILRKC